MNKYTIEQKNRSITEKFKKRFNRVDKGHLTNDDIKNELLVWIQEKTGKSKEEILAEINHFIE